MKMYISCGGSWYTEARYVQATNRGWHAPSVRDYYLGFRLVRSYE